MDHFCPLTFQGGIGGVGSPKICALMGPQQPVPAEKRKLAPSAAGTQYYHTGLGKMGLIKGGEGGERREKGGVSGPLLQPQGRGGRGRNQKSLGQRIHICHGFKSLLLGRWSCGGRGRTGWNKQTPCPQIVSGSLLLLPSGHWDFPYPSLSPGDSGMTVGLALGS